MTLPLLLEQHYNLRRKLSSGFSERRCTLPSPMPSGRRGGGTRGQARVPATLQAAPAHGRAVAHPYVTTQRLPLGSQWPCWGVVRELGGRDGMHLQLCARRTHAAPFSSATHCPPVPPAPQCGWTCVDTVCVALAHATMEWRMMAGRQDDCSTSTSAWGHKKWILPWQEAEIKRNSGISTVNNSLEPATCRRLARMGMSLAWATIVSRGFLHHTLALSNTKQHRNRPVGRPHCWPSN